MDSAHFFVRCRRCGVGLTPSHVVQIMDQLGGKFVAVRGDQYFSLAPKANGLPEG